MRIYQKYGRDYRLPNVLNDFQLEMYIHLINWKWGHITKEPGIYVHRGQQIPYDAILPESLKDSFPIVYPPVVEALKRHHEKYYFKLHEHFNHMASSQAANANLFLAVLLSPQSNQVMQQLKSDFNTLAIEKLDSGFQLEFWGAPTGKGLLGDHTKRFGTDSDIAIAYYNKNQELSLWLIEHKLTEQDFTPCHGITSNGRDFTRHDCSRTFSEIIEKKSFCYYHDARNFNYWNITEKNQTFFPNHVDYSRCPFQGGTNQLWRNQLLALAIEGDGAQRYKHVYFSVVKHAGNTALDETIRDYQHLIRNNDKFSVFTSADVINAARRVDDGGLNQWAKWYKELYNISSASN